MYFNYFAIISPLGEGGGPSVEQVWISLTHIYIVLSFEVIDLVLEKKMFKFCSFSLICCFFIFSPSPPEIHINNKKRLDKFLKNPRSDMKNLWSQILHTIIINWLLESFWWFEVGDHAASACLYVSFMLVCSQPLVSRLFLD